MVKRNNKWKVLKKGVAFKNPWRQIDVWTVCRPDGCESEFYFSVGPEIVVIFALTKKEEVVIIYQHHIYEGKKVADLPAGYSEGGSLLAAAKRELREETGYASKKWEKLGRVHLGKWSSNSAHIYLAKDAEWVGQQTLEPSEDITVSLLPLDKVLPLINNKYHADSLSVVAVYMALERLNYWKKVKPTSS